MVGRGCRLAATVLVVALLVAGLGQTTATSSVRRLRQRVDVNDASPAPAPAAAADEKGVQIVRKPAQQAEQSAAQQESSASQQQQQESSTSEESSAATQQQATTQQQESSGAAPAVQQSTVQQKLNGTELRAKLAAMPKAGTQINATQTVKAPVVPPNIPPRPKDMSVEDYNQAVKEIKLNEERAQQGLPPLPGTIVKLRPDGTLSVDGDKTKCPPKPTDQAAGAAAGAGTVQAAAGAGAGAAASVAGSSGTIAGTTLQKTSSAKQSDIENRAEKQWQEIYQDLKDEHGIHDFGRLPRDYKKLLKDFYKQLALNRSNLKEKEKEAAEPGEEEDGEKKELPCCGDPETPPHVFTRAVLERGAKKFAAKAAAKNAYDPNALKKLELDPKLTVSGKVFDESDLILHKAQERHEKFVRKHKEQCNTPECLGQPVDANTE